MTDAFPPPRGTDAAADGSASPDGVHGSAVGSETRSDPPPTDELPLIPSPPTSAPASPPRRRSLVPLAVVGALAAIVLLVGVVVAVSSGSSDDESFSLDAALASAREATSVEYDMVTTTETPAGTVPVTVRASADSESGLMVMEVDAATLIGDELPPGASGTIEIMFDGGTSTIYMRAGDLFGDLGDFLGVDVEWISFDLDDLYELSSLGGGDPAADIATMLDQTPLAMLDGVSELAADAEVIGTENIDGEELRHYRVEVDDPSVVYGDLDTDAITDMLGGMLDLDGVPDVGEAMAELIDEMSYDFWVTEDGVLRRIEISIVAQGVPSDLVFDIVSIGEPLDLAPPPDDEVFSFDDILGG